MPKSKKKQNSNSLIWVIGVVVIVAIALGIYLVMQPGSSSESIETQALALHGEISLLQGVETFDEEGRDHVPSGDLKFETNPPTSGDHRPSVAPARYYGEKPEPGLLVHSLEHGAVVIYHNPSRTTPEEEKSLRAFANRHTSTWASVLVIPTTEYEAPFILTAWRKTLKLEKYDAKVVHAFLSEYIGRGPENKVR